MRYVVLLAMLGKRLEAMMRSEGVEENTIESWSVYYGQLCRDAGTCEAAEMDAVAARIASLVGTSLYYVRKAGES